MLHSNMTGFLDNYYDIETSVDMLIEAGFPAIDVSMFKITAFPYVEDYKEVCARLKAKADAAGVKFVQAHAPFAHPKEEIIEKYLERDFEVCALLGIPVIVVHPLTVGRYNESKEPSYKANIEYYNSIKHFAKKYGVKIALENMFTVHPITKRRVDAACADPYELCRLYDDLNDPECFTICLDLGHVVLCNREADDAIRIVGHRLGCLHVHDNDYVEDLHTLPGSSKMNWEKICRALADVNYSGVFNLEVENFLPHFFPEHHKMVVKFISDTARVFAAKVEEYKAELKA